MACRATLGNKRCFSRYNRENSWDGALWWWWRKVTKGGFCYAVTNHGDGNAGVYVTWNLLNLPLTLYRHSGDHIGESCVVRNQLLFFEKRKRWFGRWIE